MMYYEKLLEQSSKKPFVPTRQTPSSASRPQVNFIRKNANISVRGKSKKGHRNRSNAAASITHVPRAESTCSEVNFDNAKDELENTKPRTAKKNKRCTIVIKDLTRLASPVSAMSPTSCGSKTSKKQWSHMKPANNKRNLEIKENLT